jgi:hypothetical protein
MRRRALGFCLTVIVPAALAAAPVPRPFNYTFKNRYADVEYSWSAEAAAIPALVKRFRADLAKARANSIQCGKVETETRRKMGESYPSVVCSSSTKVTTSGETPRLLSLRRAYYAFTGGAHGNGASTGILWDRKLGREIPFGSLFPRRSAGLAVLRDRYCRALDAERKKRRGGDAQAGGGMFPEFNSCPKFADLALIPADTNRDHRFDRIHIVAAPYTAGPYSEGEYDIALPVPPKLVQGMTAGYRGSFAAQRQ